MNMMTETTFSHDSDLEEAVIGACMIERAAMPLVADKLRPEMFYEEKNLEIFAALQSMYRSVKSIDTITLKNELAARGKLDAVGGPYELLRISSKVSSSAHLEYHALILRQLHTRRIMRTGFQQLLAFSADESMDIDDILVEAHRLLEGLEDESGVADHLRSIDRLMDDTLAEVEQRMEHGCNGITGIPTGFDALDHVTAGWQRGDLNILAARPSVGKILYYTKTERQGIIVLVVLILGVYAAPKLFSFFTHAEDTDCRENEKFDKEYNDFISSLRETQPHQKSGHSFQSSPQREIKLAVRGSIRPWRAQAASTRSMVVSPAAASTMLSGA